MSVTFPRHHPGFRPIPQTNRSYASLPPITSAYRIYGGRPSTIPAPKRLSRDQKAGLAFQRAVYKRLENTTWSVLYEPWFAYRREGSTKTHYCSPDITQGPVVSPNGSIRFVVECKLTYQPSAWDKLFNLYLPTVALANKAPINSIALIQAFKHTTVEPPYPTYHSYHTCALDALKRPPSGLPFVACIDFAHLT